MVDFIWESFRLPRLLGEGDLDIKTMLGSGSGRCGAKGGEVRYASTNSFSIMSIVCT